MCAMKKEEDNILFVIDGFEVERDSIYKIGNKLDEAAPSGWQDKEFSKAPLPGVAESFRCPFDGRAKVYNTGFYAQSECYRDLSEDDKNKEIKRRIKNVLTPFEETRGDNVNLDQSNFEFWDSHSVKIDNTTTFRTSDPIERFNLYITLLDRKATPIELIGNPNYNDSMYTISKLNDSSNKANDRQSRILEAIFKFMSMLRGEQKQLAIDLFVYIGGTVHPITDPGFIETAFKYWIEDKSSYLAEFENLIKRIENETGFKDVLKFYRMLVFLRSQSIVTSSENGYMFGGSPIGTDLKQIATRMVNNDDSANLVTEVLDAYENKVLKNLK